MTDSRLFESKLRRSAYDNTHLVGYSSGRPHGLVSYFANDSSVLLVIELGDKDNQVYGIYCDVARGKNGKCSVPIKISEEEIQAHLLSFSLVSSFGVGGRLEVVQQNFGYLIKDENNFEGLNRKQILTRILLSLADVLENFLAEEEKVSGEEKKSFFSSRK
jgi:hypothetical protein